MAPSRNLLLASLSSEDAALLKTHLRSVRYQQGHILFEAGGRVALRLLPHQRHYLAGRSTGQRSTGRVGDGRPGRRLRRCSSDGRATSPSRAIVQVTGDVLVCDAPALKLAVSRSPTLSSVLIRHKQTVYAQAQQSTACMAAHEVEQRLCRWLLRARDLCGLDELAFTQEFLAEMLGVRRTSVTEAACGLQQEKIIAYARGKIRHP